MNQPRTASLIESVFNVVIGYGVALASQLAIFPMFGIHLPLSDNLAYAVVAWIKCFNDNELAQMQALLQKAKGGDK